MKTLLIWLAIMLQCLPCYAGGVLMLGGGVAAVATCSTGTANVTATDTDGSSTLGEANITIGQSFTVSATDTLHSIAIDIPTVTTGATITMRVGTSANLSSTYLDEASLSVSTTGLKEFVFPNHPSLTASTTYYFMFGYAGTVGSLAFNRNNSDTYANGSRRFGATTLFNGDTDQSSSDLYFIVKLCD